jgi:hypothetical protein
VRGSEDERRKMEEWGFREMPPLTGLDLFLVGRVLQRFRPYGAWGVWRTRFVDDRDGARIAQIEHRRCDISVAARAATSQSSVRSGIAERARWRPR